jgi:Flp pilus assembly protein TadB
MTIHPVTITATVIVVGLAALATWLVQRALRRRNGRAGNNVAQ